MVMVDVDDSSLQVGWLGLRVISHLALFYIHQMNQMNSCTYTHRQTDKSSLIYMISLFYFVYLSIKGLLKNLKFIIMKLFTLLSFCENE